MIRRGDTVSFTVRNIPGIPDQTGCAVVLRILQQRGTAVLKLWNGKILDDPGDHYTEVEVPIKQLYLYRRRPKGRGKRGGARKK